MGFLNLGPTPKGVQHIELPFHITAKEVSTPSQPVIKEEEEIVEVSDSEDDFEVFNRPQSPEALAEDFNSLPLAYVGQA